MLHNSSIHVEDYLHASSILCHAEAQKVIKNAEIVTAFLRPQGVMEMDAFSFNFLFLFRPKIKKMCPERLVRVDLLYSALIIQWTPVGYILSYSSCNKTQPSKRVYLFH